VSGVKAFIRSVRTREEAHAAISAAYAHAKQLIADGQRVRVQVGPDDDLMSARQRRFLHGPVLTQIAEQAWVGGRQYAMPIWKEHYRAKLLGSAWETVTLPGQEPKPFEVRRSTEDLSTRDYSDYIDLVIADAVTEHGVEFHFREGEREATRWPHQSTHRQKEHAPC